MSTRAELEQFIKNVEDDARHRPFPSPLDQAAIHNAQRQLAEYDEIDRVAGLDSRIEALEDLVRWLALPYGENTPLFATATWDGQPLETGKRMAELYAEVVGGRSEPPRVGVAWTRCPTCDSFQTIPVEP